MNGFGASQGASFRNRRTASGARGRSVRLGRPEAVASVAMAGRICPVSFTFFRLPCSRRWHSRRRRLWGGHSIDDRAGCAVSLH